MQILQTVKRQIAAFFAQSNAEAIDSFLLGREAIKPKPRKRRQKLAAKPEPPPKPDAPAAISEQPQPPVRFYLLGKEIGNHTMWMSTEGRSVVVVRAWNIDHAFDQLVARWPECRQHWVLRTLSSHSPEAVAVLDEMVAIDPRRRILRFPIPSGFLSA